MQESGFNSGVLWPGFFSCFELYSQAGDSARAREYVERAYQLVCQAKGAASKDARAMLKYTEQHQQKEQLGCAS
jgi:hypothetical protein